MAIQVEVTIRSEDTVLNNNTIIIPCIFRTIANMQLQSLSVTISQTGLTPSNFVSNFKTQAIATLLSQYGINVNTNEVIVYGAPQ